MNLRDRVLGRGERALSMQDLYGDLANYIGPNGISYPITTTYQTGTDEPPASNYWGLSGLFKSNPVVFACIITRLSLVTEGRFAFRRYRNGVPGDLFGTPALSILERPDVNVSTGDLLERMELDVSLCGNAFNVRTGERIIRLKPDNVTIIAGTPNAGVENPNDDPEVQVVGYVYDAGRGDPPRVFFPEETSHFVYVKDPDCNFRGMSWLSSAIRESHADDQATSFRNQFYRQGATPNMVVTLDKSVTFENFEKFKAAFNEEHEGILNAFKTLFLGGGADAKVIGSSFEQMAYTAVQQAGENRVCMAANVPAVMVGAQSGLDTATYSNMGQARRLFADSFGRGWWRKAAQSLEHLVQTPSDARLDVDTDDIAFLRDDGKDIAEIQMGQASAIKALTEAGFTPDSVVDAVVANDLARLKGNHSGLQSVQLVPPASGQTMNGAQDTPPATP